MKIRLILPCLILLTASLACGVYPLVSAPTPTAGATPVPLTPILTSLAPALTLTPLANYFLEEDFNANVTNWSILVTSGDPGLLDQHVENGSWVFNIDGKSLSVLALYRPTTFKNVRIDLKMVNRGGMANSLNVICRYTSMDGWYQFELFDTGLFNLYHVTWDENLKPVPTLLTEGNSAAMLPGESENQVSVVCKNFTLSLYVNGQLAVSYTDSVYALGIGQVGLGVSSFEHLPVLVDFDWVKLGPP